MPAVCFQPADYSQHIDLAEQIVFKPEDDLVLLFMVTKRSVFFKRLLYKPRLADVVILMQKIESGLPE
jgi:hypothetical protein